MDAMCRECLSLVRIENPACPVHPVHDAVVDARWYAYERRMRVADPLMANRQLAEKFIQDQQHICGRVFFEVAPRLEDVAQATDLVSLWLPRRRLRIACRLRRWKYLEFYQQDFTLRTTGRPSELHKVLQGWGDYLLYCLLTPDEMLIDRWWMGDFAVWRRWYHDEANRLAREPAWRVDPQTRREQVGVPLADVLPTDRRPGQASPDGTFRTFRLSDLPPTWLWKTSAHVR